MFQYLTMNPLGIFDTITSHPDFPVVLLSVIIGGFLTLISNFILMRRRFSVEKKRLRRAFKTEIQQLNLSELAFIVQELDSSAESAGVLDDFISTMNEVAEAVQESGDNTHDVPLIDPVEIKQQALVEAGEKLTDINLSTEIYDANTDKIGKLTSSEIELIIRFYKLLGGVITDLNQLIEIAEKSLDESETEDALFSYESQVKQLSETLDRLSGLETETVEELEKSPLRRYQDSISGLFTQLASFVRQDESEASEEEDSSSMSVEEWYSSAEADLEQLLSLHEHETIDHREHEVLQSNFEEIPPELMELALDRSISIPSQIRGSLIGVSRKHTNVAAVCTREDLQDQWPVDEDEDAERIKIEVMLEEVRDTTQNALDQVQEAQSGH